MVGYLKDEALLVSFVKENFEKLEIHSSLYSSIKIINLGKENFTDGPDFLNSLVSFDGKVEKGDIEIHINSSLWYTHNHHNNEKYKNTILNICLRDDSKEGYNIYSLDKIIPVGWIDNNLFEQYINIRGNKIGRKNPMINGLCQLFHIHNMPEKFLKNAGMYRFSVKVKRFRNLIEKYGFEEAFYISVMEALGYAHNRTEFIRLAKIANFALLKKLYAEGKLPSSSHLCQLYKKTVDSIVESEGKNFWNTKSVYPYGTPEYKLKIIAPFILYLLSKNVEITKSLQNWCSLYRQKKLDKFLVEFIKSKYVVKNIIFNVFLPFFKIVISDFSNDDILLFKPLPLNTISKYAIKRMFPATCKIKLRREIEQQGLIYLSQNYCLYGLKGCEACPLYIEYTT